MRYFSLLALLCILLAQQPSFAQCNPKAVLIDTSFAPFCEGDKVVLEAHRDTAYSYQWLRDGNLIAGAIQDKYAATQPGLYQLVVSTFQGQCRDTSDEVEIEVYPLPQSGITYHSPLAFCEGGSIIFTAQQAPGLVYQWYRNNQPIGGANLPYYEANKSGAYAVKLLNLQGCSITSNSVTITVYANPTPPIVRNGLVLSTATYPSYQWYRNNQPIPNAYSQVYTVTQPGSYLVETVTNDGCINRSALEILGSLSTAEMVKEHLKIYPNPARNIVQIETPKPVNIRVQNVAGQQMISVQNAAQIDMSQWTSGMYLFTITDADGEVISREKVIKLD